MICNMYLLKSDFLLISNRCFVNCKIYFNVIKVSCFNLKMQEKHITIKGSFYHFESLCGGWQVYRFLV